MIFAFKLILIMGQLYWRLILKDDAREDVVWDACLYPGE